MMTFQVTDANLMCPMPDCNRLGEERQPLHTIHDDEGEVMPDVVRCSCCGTTYRTQVTVVLTTIEETL